jgi:hypothetical protein
MINVCRSISFTTQILQDHEDEQSTQHYVIDVPLPAAAYPDFFSIDCLHATFTFLNKYIFQMRSHNVMQFLHMVKTTQKIYFYLFYVLFYLFLSYYNYCVYYRTENFNVTVEKVSVREVVLSERAEFILYDFRGKKRTPASTPSIRE